MPGLADLHVHFWNENNLALFLRNGLTSVRNMRGTPLHRYWQRRVESGGIPGPKIYTTSPIVDSSPRTWPQSKAVRSAEQAHTEVKRQKAAGYEALKVYANLTRDAYDALVVAAKVTGMRFER